jgi:hypothetical protein
MLIVQDDSAIQQLRSRYFIFQNISFESEGPAGSFVHRCALQHCVSSTIFAIIERLHFIIAPDGTPGTDPSLEALCRQPHNNTQHELIWKLVTVNKLDSRCEADNGIPPTNQARKNAVLKALDPVLKRFQPTDELTSPLEELASIVVELWSALRQDRRQLHFDFAPPHCPKDETKGESDCWLWARMEDKVTEGWQSPANLAPAAIESYVLFPRITATPMDSQPAHPGLPSTTVQLLPGLALAGTSPAFALSRFEDEQVRMAMKRVRRNPSESHAVSAPLARNQVVL